MSRIFFAITLLTFASIQLFALNQQQQRNIFQILSYLYPTPIYDLQVQRLLIDCANDVVVKVQQEVEALSIGQTTNGANINYLNSINPQQLMNMMDTSDDYVIQHDPIADGEYINYQCNLYETWGYKVMVQLKELHDDGGTIAVQGVIMPVENTYQTNSDDRGWF